MRYMLMICHDDAFSPPATMVEESLAWVEETERRGVRKGGDRLRPASDATTVRIRGGEVMLSDGPFAETKEQMAGYGVVKCENLDDAIEVASTHPILKYGGSVEVRPFWEG